jgi:ATP-binding cassette subfamily B protein
LHQGTLDANWSTLTRPDWVGTVGLGVDVIQFHLNPKAKAPGYPLGLQPPPDVTTLQVVATIAAVMLVLALLRAWLTFIYTISINHLVQAEIVVDLRAQVYAKLQRISFRFSTPTKPAPSSIA